MKKCCFKCKHFSYNGGYEVDDLKCDIFKCHKIFDPFVVPPFCDKYKFSLRTLVEYYLLWD